jgi:hypothetical protein
MLVGCTSSTGTATLTINGQTEGQVSAWLDNWKAVLSGPPGTFGAIADTPWVIYIARLPTGTDCGSLSTPGWELLAAIGIDLPPAPDGGPLTPNIATGDVPIEVLPATAVTSEVSDVTVGTSPELDLASGTLTITSFSTGQAEGHFEGSGSDTGNTASGTFVAPRCDNWP